MDTRRKMLAAAAAVAASVVGVGAVAATANDYLGSQPDVEQSDDPGQDAVEGPDVPITGTALERASQAALDYLGGGRVTGTEVGDEESYYEVEVTLDDGRQVDVQLDEAFDVVGTTD
jgi:uncharacterized membrane protein YkoI